MPIRNIKNLRIVRVLLDKPDGSLTKYRIAKLSGSSVPWVIEFLRKLESQKIIKDTKVIDKNKLIDYYISKSSKNKHFDFYVKDPLKFLKKSKLDYALTTYGAENLTAHHLFPSRYDVYIKEEDINKWKKIISKEGLFGKGNLRLIITKDRSIFDEARIIKKIKIVPESQLLADLKNEGGPCLEAYEILIKNV